MPITRYQTPTKCAVLRGLEIGVNDYLLRPVDKNEFGAGAHPDQKRATPTICATTQNSIEAMPTL